MREELERRLGIEFPFMRESGDEGESYTVSEVSSSYKDRNCERSFRYEWVHCDCGDGWYELIRELCRSKKNMGNCVFTTSMGERHTRQIHLISLLKEVCVPCRMMRRKGSSGRRLGRLSSSLKTGAV